MTVLLQTSLTASRPPLQYSRFSMRRAPPALGDHAGTLSEARARRVCNRSSPRDAANPLGRFAHPPELGTHVATSVEKYGHYPNEDASGRRNVAVANDRTDKLGKVPRRVLGRRSRFVDQRMRHAVYESRRFMAAMSGGQSSERVVEKRSPRACRLAASRPASSSQPSLASASSSIAR